MKRNKGFTLIELMIVVAIIAIIVAIAIPNLMRSRIQSNESSAIGNLRTILGAQVAFNASTNAYATDLATLGGTNPPYLDGNWAGIKNGYNFASVLNATGTNFACTADPAEPNVTGVRGFFVDASGVIRAEDPAPATAASAPLGE